jgi:hypothetical protein
LLVLLEIEVNPSLLFLLLKNFHLPFHKVYNYFYKKKIKDKNIKYFKKIYQKIKTGTKKRGLPKTSKKKNKISNLQF